MSRKSRGLNPKPKIYFFVEGETEQAFFETLKQEFRLTSSITIKILKNGSGNELEKSLKQLKNNSSYHVDSKTRIFIIFDRDNKDKNKCLQMIAEAKKTKYRNSTCKIGLSNISFEVWLLAHYKPISQSFHSEKYLENQLTDKLGIKYKKADKEQIKSIISDDKINDAIKNTSKISEINNHTIDGQFTNVGDIVKEVISIN